jgi:hypothetical protein
MNKPSEVHLSFLKELAELMERYAEHDMFFSVDRGIYTLDVWMKVPPSMHGSGWSEISITETDYSIDDKADRRVTVADVQAAYTKLLLTGKHRKNQNNL